MTVDFSDGPGSNTLQIPAFAALKEPAAQVSGQMLATSTWAGIIDAASFKGALPTPDMTALSQGVVASTGVSDIYKQVLPSVDVADFYSPLLDQVRDLLGVVNVASSLTETVDFTSGLVQKLFSIGTVLPDMQEWASQILEQDRQRREFDTLMFADFAKRMATAPATTSDAVVDVRWLSDAELKWYGLRLGLLALAAYWTFVTVNDGNPGVAAVVAIVWQWIDTVMREVHKRLP